MLSSSLFYLSSSLVCLAVCGLGIDNKTFPFFFLLFYSVDGQARVGEVSGLGSMAMRGNDTLVHLNKMRFKGVESVDLSGRDLHSLLYESFFIGSRMGLPDCVTKHLELQRCRLSPRAVQEICNGVDVCETVESFLINDNDDIGTSGVTYLTRMLSRNRSIETMHMEQVGMRDEGADRLFETVVNGLKVRDFSVRRNTDLTRNGEAKCAAMIWKPASVLEVLNIDIRLRGCKVLNLAQRGAASDNLSDGGSDNGPSPLSERLALYEAAFIGDQLSREEVQTEEVLLNGNMVDAAACAHVCKGAVANPV